MSASRAANESILRCLPPSMIGGCGRCTGWVAGQVLKLVMLATERDGLLSEKSLADLHCFGQPFEPLARRAER